MTKGVTLHYPSIKCEKKNRFPASGLVNGAKGGILQYYNVII